MISTASITTRLSGPLFDPGRAGQTAAWIASTEVLRPACRPRPSRPAGRTAAEAWRRGRPAARSSGHCHLQGEVEQGAAHAGLEQARATAADQTRPTTIAPGGLCVGTSLKNSAPCHLPAGYMPRLSR